MLRALTYLIILLIGLPFLPILGSLFLPFGADMQHLMDTKLAEYITNSVAIFLGVGVLSALIGVTTAWLTTFFQFPGRRLLAFALVLPLTFPTYVIAYMYGYTLDFAGPVQSFLREWFGWAREDYAFPQIRSLGGAILLMSLVLYPYVYMLSRVIFMRCGDIMNVGKTLGLSAPQQFTRILLPSCRPVIIAGAALASMEAIADFGAVEHLAVDTLTTGIYRSWYGLYNPLVAARLAGMLFLVVMAFFAIERVLRGKKGYHDATNATAKTPQRMALSGSASALAITICALPVLLGFAIPFIQMIVWIADSGINDSAARISGFISNTVYLAVIAAALVMAIATLFGWVLSHKPSSLTRMLIRFSAVGYIVPGAVIAVAVMLAFSWFTNGLQWLTAQFGEPVTLLLTGTSAALVVAYVVRFLAIGLNASESAFTRITPSIRAAAMLYAKNTRQSLTHIYSPILFKSLLVGGILVFIETVKELPATLIIRPFNLDTLATRTYELASDERIFEAAGPALVISLVSLVGVLLLSRHWLREE